MNLRTRVATVVIAALMSCVATCSLAQNLNNSNHTSSPYTRHGYGRLGSVGNAVTRSMGDAGIALRSNQYTTLANPASLTAIDTLTCLFSVGLDAQFGTFTEGAATDRKWDAGFSYMSFQVPLWRNFAASLSLTPYSMVGYSYGSVDSLAVQSPTNPYDTLTYSNVHGGVGGVNNFMFGLGWRALHSKRQELNVGVNLGWLFGNIEHYGQLATSSQANGTYITYDLGVRGMLVQLGTQYVCRWGKGFERSLTLGATFSPEMSLSTDTRAIKYSTDTVLVTGKLRDVTRLPMRYGLGLTYAIARKLTVTAEYEATRWSDVEGLDAELRPVEGIYADVHRFCVGAEYLPKVMTNNYFKACRYRGGLSYQNSYLQVNGADLRELSANLGMSLNIPAARRTTLDLGVGYTTLRPSVGSMVKEDYLTLTLGLTFNEMMFFRNRLR